MNEVDVTLEVVNFLLALDTHIIYNKNVIFITKFYIKM